MRHLDELQVGERSDVEVGRVLLRRDAVVELAVAAADGKRLGAVGSAQRGCPVQPAEVGWRTKLCTDTSDVVSDTQKRKYTQKAAAGSVSTVQMQISERTRCSERRNQTSVS